MNTDSELSVCESYVRKMIRKYLYHFVDSSIDGYTNATIGNDEIDIVLEFLDRNRGHTQLNELNFDWSNCKFDSRYQAKIDRIKAKLIEFRCQEDLEMLQDSE